MARNWASFPSFSLPVVALRVGGTIVRALALEKRTADMKEKEARIVALEKETAELKAKQAYFESVAARPEAPELKFNFLVQVRTNTLLSDDLAGVNP